MYKLLKTITNNDASQDPRDVAFDIYFFACSFVLLVSAIVAFLSAHDAIGWCCVIGIEFNWSWEQIRNNRS